MSTPAPRLKLTALAVAWAFAPAALADNPATRIEAPTVEVVGTTPVPGLGTAREEVPSNVQAATGSDIRKQQSLTLPDFLNSTQGSVIINDVQGNPLQPEVLYRGFTASPLLGAPQGVSVFLDGVRVNEPFGDVVNWDLIPQSAISAINVIPGSNPLFGLNTLGGSLAIRTKSGETHPGGQLELSGGSWARKQGEFEYGAARDGTGVFVTGNWFDEDGWRDHSPSKAKHLFAKLGHQNDSSDLDLSLLLADTDLTGNGFTPQSLMQQRRESIYTYPDNTRNELAFLTLNGNHFLSDSLLLSGNVYYRRLKTRTFNGDLNEITDNRFGVVPFEDGPNDGVANVDSAADNRSHTDQDGYGFVLQLSLDSEGKDGASNRLSGGLSHDRGNTDFRQSYQLGIFNPDRGTTATGAETENVNIKGLTKTTSIFLTDTWSWSKAWHLTLSGRYNHTNVQTVDRLDPVFPAPALGLDNDYTYKRLNPAVGLSFTPHERYSAYLGYNQGNRAPSPIELGCSDPNTACRLPNSMASDPFLNQVIAKTLEGGVRGKAGDGDWNLSLFRTENSNDILFISTSTGGAGYFQNFGKTRRQGLEAALSGRSGRLSWGASYAYIEATFQSTAIIAAENNSARDALTADAVAAGNDDQIQVNPGNRIPGVPKHALKLNLDYAVTDRWDLGFNVVALSDQIARGNENNQHQTGTFTNSQGNTRTFNGAGKVDAYAVVNLHTSFRFDRNWEIFGRINNLFDTDYETGAILGETAFPGGTFDPDSGNWAKETFFSPGAPRAAWVGIRYVFDAPGKK